MSGVFNLPSEQIPMSKKTKEWRRKHLDWADKRGFYNYSPVRQSVLHKIVNYDLMDGKLHIRDLAAVLNPEGLKEKETPKSIQHFPIMKSKLDLLVGEESDRVFDHRVIVTNPNAVSKIEEDKKEALFQSLRQWVEDNYGNSDQASVELDKINDYYNFEWQDLRELQANCLLNHYDKEQNFPLIFSNGFRDALICGEELYRCMISGGEPVLQKLNPKKVRIFKSGYSNRVEDADIIVIEDYLNPGRVVDMFYDSKDINKDAIEYIESGCNASETDPMGMTDETRGFVNMDMVDDVVSVSGSNGEGFILDPLNMFGGNNDGNIPFDNFGNVRVVTMYWKSRRRIKKVKSYDPETGEVIYNFYPESYVLDTAAGEEETIYYVNEAWEGTKIGEKLYVNIRPMPVQYNSLSSPSRCHFGIVGTIYNLNEGRPYSMVDIMKPFNYAYDVVYDRLNKLLARNWGKLIDVDLAKIPKKWDIDKWLYFARKSGINVTNSFNEGSVGTATGVLAGSLNNNTRGVSDAELGNSIQFYISLLEYLKTSMSDISGISRQREGQVSNRETVGGIERSTLQSSLITMWWYKMHDDTKKRVYECFLETAKIAMKGGSKKFQYILPDNSLKIMEIDGDNFAECDYGLVVDASNQAQLLNGKLDTLAQAALQNQMINFSTVMKLYGSVSLAEKQRLIERSEQEMQENQERQAQAQQEAQQRQIEANAQIEQARMQHEDEMNQRDNETRLAIASLSARSGDDGVKEQLSAQEAFAKLKEAARQFDIKTTLDKDRLDLDTWKAKADVQLKNKEIDKKPVTKATSK